MERQLLERMIGAAVLVVALVVIVPAILDGRSDDARQVLPDAPGPGPAAPSTPMRQHTIRLDRPADSPPVARRAPAAAPSAPPADALQAEPPRNPAPTADSRPESGSGPAPASTPAPIVSPSSEVTETPATAATQSGWIVQLGSFSNRANAQGLADQAQAKGFDAYLMPVQRSGKTLYRVRVGPPRKTRDAAASLANDLRRAGISGQVAEQLAERQGG